LAAGPVQGAHELGSGTLTKGVVGHQLLGVRHHLTVAAEGQIGLDAVLGGSSAQLLQASDVLLDRLLVGDVGEGRPPPQPERLLEQLRRR